MLPDGDHQALAASAAVAVMLVPAALMVSTIRYRSFKTINFGWGPSYLPLLVFILLVALVATHPRITLLIFAYTYLIWRIRRDGHYADAVAPGGSTGSVTVTVVPCPRRLASVTVPPQSSMFRRALARPRPDPLVLVEKYGSNARRTPSSSIPTPVSITRSSTASSGADASTRSRPPLGIA